MIDNLSHSFYYQVKNLSLIAVRGKDSLQFLHRQFSNAVIDISQDVVRLAGVCTLQGRLFASIYYYLDCDAIFLIVSADLAVSLITHLEKFILRSKVKFEIVDNDYALLGLAFCNQNTSNPFNLLQLPMQSMSFSSGKLLRLHDAKINSNMKTGEFSTKISRLLWIMPRQFLIEAEQLLCNSQIHPQETGNGWDTLEIYSGIARITLATQNKFVPQMINFEVVGGIDFKKGCYPGQEVVARIQYKGKIKRRLRIAVLKLSAVENAAMPGSLLFLATEPIQECGMVVNVAADNIDGQNTQLLLVEISLEAIDKEKIVIYNQFYAKNSEKISNSTRDFSNNIELLPTPYAIPANIL